VAVAVRNIPMKSSDKRRYRAKAFRVGAFKRICYWCSSGQRGKLLQGKADATEKGYYPATNSHAEYDFTNQSGALQPDTIVDSACQFCNSLCRLKVHVKNGRIIDVLGEPDDPVQAGGFCVKGPMMTQLVYNRFRLTRQ
jgi:anaerobic selenocysteine-containing dehydrogenase